MVDEVGVVDKVVVVTEVADLVVVGEEVVDVVVVMVDLRVEED